VAQYLGPARLEWWANASTCLAAYHVTVVLEPATEERATIGTGRAHLDLDADVEAFAWLCNLDPVFLLCLPDGHEVTVVLELGPDRLSFALSRYDGPPEREITATLTPRS
jgi:hypothetical protein